MTDDPFEAAREARRQADLRLTPAERLRAIESWTVQESADSKHPTRVAILCRALNDSGARYLVAGAHAATLWGYARYTNDFDILIQATEDNAARVLDALNDLGFILTRDLDPAEVARRHVTMIGDLYHVDLLTVAFSVRYEDAEPTRIIFDVDGVPVPTLSLEMLIRSKQTDRAQDQLDVEELEKLRRRLTGGPGAAPGS